MTFVSLQELEKTIADQNAEIADLRKVLRSVLSTIEGMRATEHEVGFIPFPEGEEQPDLEMCWLFGSFGTYFQFSPDDAGYETRAIIEWPDLDLAATDIRRVLHPSMGVFAIGGTRGNLTVASPSAALPGCLRCGKELITTEGEVTGICPECWIRGDGEVA